MDVIEIETPHGPARAHLEEPDGTNGLVVLGHGAGGGVGAPDLVRAELEARKLGFATALVEQPYGSRAQGAAGAGEGATRRGSPVLAASCASGLAIRCR